ncbi:MAG: FAD-dependent oxidoreductase [Euryarchaeota archaeon]|nr:FAD-dependent oxidoreductase [Euryarchaeota archaeon]MDE2045183.1 FAD-dependent oxidoreductase [Thermoplasmata archaeon]
MSGAYRQSRVDIPEVSVQERCSHMGEILHAYDRGEAIMEAQRCLQCSMPYCVQACPITQDCKGYIDMVAQGRFDDAARVTLLGNPLATVLCKSCYHYCEEDCVKGGKGVAIAIRHLKRASLQFGDSDLQYVPMPSRGERVAVVGGGPAGIMATWELCLRGYSVTLYEAQPFLGGQVETIPKYHLDGDELEIDMARFKRFDLKIVTGKRCGVDFTPEQLLADGNLAVFLAIGASASGPLKIPGEELPGVFHALPFLLNANHNPEGFLGRRDRKAIIIGGGDVAMDAARSCIRFFPGQPVTVCYRRSEEEMPASEEEREGMYIEGVKFMPWRAPVRILGKDHVEGLVVARTELGPPDARGKRSVIVLPNTEETIPCDTIIAAVGQVADLRGFPQELDLKTPRGWPEGKASDWATGVEGVFASGNKSIVFAMSAGSRAAEAIDAYLAKKLGRAVIPRPHPFGEPVPVPPPSGYGDPAWSL